MTAGDLHVEPQPRARGWSSGAVVSIIQRTLQRTIQQPDDGYSTDQVPLSTWGAVDTDQLLTFERIVREGSFSRAAWSLDLAQPTVSARIHALEQSVGGPLFAR